MRSTVMIVAALVLGALQAHAEMRLTSKNLMPGQPMANAQVFDQFGCHGGNASPQLAWSGAPPGTKSFAILAFDPDAPTGSGWWHWVVFNIPASVTEIAFDASRAGKLPRGAMQSRTDFAITGYGGACPRSGAAFTVTSSRSTPCLLPISRKVVFQSIPMRPLPWSASPSTSRRWPTPHWKCPTSAKPGHTLAPKPDAMVRS